MSAYEQRIEPPDRRWQYLLMAAEPYETIAFKVEMTKFQSSPLRISADFNTTNTTINKSIL